MSGRVLVLIRHAKAVADAPSDVQRPLAGRGHRDAAAAGKWLAELGITPDLVVTSQAVRARETWEEIGLASAVQDVQIDERIYENTVADLLAVITDVTDDVQTLALVGHNPSMHGLAITLADGNGDQEAESAIRSDYPT